MSGTTSECFHKKCIGKSCLSSNKFKKFHHINTPFNTQMKFSFGKASLLVVSSILGSSISVVACEANTKDHSLLRARSLAVNNNDNATSTTTNNSNTSTFESSIAANTINMTASSTTTTSTNVTTSIPSSMPTATTCTDRPGFVDVLGTGCAWYEMNDTPGCPMFGDLTGLSSDVTAKNSCCYCFDDAGSVSVGVVDGVVNSLFAYWIF